MSSLTSLRAETGPRPRPLPGPVIPEGHHGGVIATAARLDFAIGPVPGSVAHGYYGSPKVTSPAGGTVEQQVQAKTGPGRS
ncbi:hypothetical protein, partial [Streptomyces puniciscabiei]|uniref:hypothetical protein n=1 Tax=Streptomyces puniciscabiei TaxID=164348 RepID=UPI001F1CBFB6